METATRSRGLQTTLISVNDFLSKYLIVMILGGLSVGYLLSAQITPFSWLLTPMLVLIVFAMGTTCTFSSFKAIVDAPRGFIVALAMVFVVMPAIGYALGIIFHRGNPDYAVGHFILAVTPVAVTSVIWTGIAGGTMALSLALVTVGTLSSGINIPAQLSLYLGAVVDINPWQFGLDLSKLIVIPVVVGLLVRDRAPRQTEALRPYIDLMAKAAMIGILVVNGAVVRPHLAGFDWHIARLLLIVALQMLLNHAVALAAAAAALGIRHPSVPAVMYGASMKNNAAGMVIAMQYFGPIVAMPVLFGMIFQQFWAGTFYQVLRFIRERPAGTAPAQKPPSPSQLTRDRVLFDSCPVPLLIHDKDTSAILDANAAALRGLGLRSLADFVAHQHVWLDPPYARQDAFGWVRRAATEGPQSVEWKRRGPNGETVWEQVDLVPVELDGVLRVMAANVNITSRREAEERVKTLAREKETLLQELQHRVKNTMNTMVSLLELQATEIESPQALTAIHDARNRFQAMGLLYDQLFRSETHGTGRVDQYLGQLAARVVGLFPSGGRIRVGVDVEQLEMDVSFLTTLGLIITELITNAMKYAFPDQADGELQIHLHCTDELIHLIVADSGTGLPHGFSINENSGFGMRIVGALVEQLGGTIRFDDRAQRGTTVTIQLPCA